MWCLFARPPSMLEIRVANTRPPGPGNLFSKSCWQHRRGRRPQAPINVFMRLRLLWSIFQYNIEWGGSRNSSSLKYISHCVHACFTTSTWMTPGRLVNVLHLPACSCGCLFGCNKHLDGTRNICKRTTSTNNFVRVLVRVLVAI